MTFLTLGLVVALAAFAATGVVGALVTGALWRDARRTPPDAMSAWRRARGLFLLRLLPAAAGLAWVGGLLVPAFSAFEPRETDEAVGIVVLVLSAAGAIVIVASVGRAFALAISTRRVARSWMRAGRRLDLDRMRVPAFRIETDFPVVSVVGVLRPRLFVSGRVIDGCSAREFAAILAHERAHLHAWDNLRRLVVRCCPDILAWMRFGRTLEDEWSAAAEEAADERAGARRGIARVDVAAALIKVARLTPSGAILAAPVSAFYRGESIERRVRRLVAATPSPARRPLWLVLAWCTLVAPVGAAITAQWHSTLLPNIHALVELAVTHLP